LTCINAGRAPPSYADTMSDLVSGTDLVSHYGSARVPRYTSYPTAPHFHDGVGADTAAAWLAALPPAEPVSLYLHVPYCDRLCWYCGCNTTVTRDDSRVARYAATLGDELALIAESLPARMAVSRIHWGGGTPTKLAPADLVSVMGYVRTLFDVAADAEIAVEIDPRSLDDATADALAESGCTRASFGVQDLNEHVQRAIGRVQPLTQVAAAAARLRDRGIDALSFDVMVGLPEQGVEDVARTIDQAVTLAPDRLAVFAYAHVPWMKKHQRLIDEAALPGAAQRLAQTEAAAARLLAHGYRAIGMDHFARPADPLARAAESGRLHRNFQGYTDDACATVLGVGASAIGALPAGYAQNAPTVGDWRARIDSGRLATVRGVALDDDDRRRRAAIERLMCDFRVDLRHVGLAIGDALADAEGFAALQRDGIAALDGATIAVTDRGRPFVRSVAACLDRYLARGAGRHAPAV